MEQTSGKEIVERIDKRLEELGLNRNRMLHSIGLPGLNLTNWIVRNTIPAADVMIEISRYLNVSVEYLVFGHDTATEQARAVEDILSTLLEEEKKDVMDFIAWKTTKRK